MTALQCTTRARVGSYERPLMPHVTRPAAGAVAPARALCLDGGFCLRRSAARARSCGCCSPVAVPRNDAPAHRIGPTGLLEWCRDRHLPPLTAQRHDLELHLRWPRDVRRFKPSTVSRRLSVVAGFYRTCVIDGVLEQSPPDNVRRPRVPPESPTLGLTHLQFEAMLTASRESTNPFDFALVCLLGLLGLRIFEAIGADIEDLGEEHGHRVLRVRARAARLFWCRCRLRSTAPWSGRRPSWRSGATTQPAGCPHGPARRNPATARARGRRWRPPTADAPSHDQAQFVTTMLDAGVDLRDVQIATHHADPRTTMRCDRARKNLNRHLSTSSRLKWPRAPDLRREGTGAGVIAMEVRGPRLV